MLISPLPNERGGHKFERELGGGVWEDFEGRHGREKFCNYVIITKKNLKKQQRSPS